MTEGAMYENVVEFRKALSQYSILNEFTMRYVKSDLVRVTARCGNQECPWRIHASVMQDKVIFQVKTLKGSRTCFSINKIGNKMATQHWVADKTLEWLRKEGDLSAMELKRWLKEKYHLNLPYYRVWRGKEIAMSKIHGKWEEFYVQMYDFKEELMSMKPRYRSILDLLDIIRQKFMVKVDERRGRGLKYEALLDEKRCSCRRWQVTRLPCAHGAVFICSIRGARWEDYVDSYFTANRYRSAYIMSMATMLDKQDWVKVDLGFKLQLPRHRRPIRRPKKNRIKDPNEPTKRIHKCKRSGEFGHYAKSRKNTSGASQQAHDSTLNPSVVDRVQGEPQPTLKVVPVLSSMFHRENQIK